MKWSRTRKYKYKVEEREVYQTYIYGYSFRARYYSMFPDGRMSSFRGYLWDGSSVPFKKIIRWATFGLVNFDRHAKESSLRHDTGYQAIREGRLPESRKLRLDINYRNKCIEDGMSVWVAQKQFEVLQSRFGDAGIKPEKNPRNKIYTTKGK